MQGSKQGFISGLTGKPIGKVIYDDAHFLREFELRGVVKTGNKYGFENCKTRKT